MRVRKTIAIAIFILMLAPLSACNPFASGQGDEIPQAEVVRGDLIMKVNGSGKTGVATDAKLAFGTGGKIEKLHVKKGDRVKKGTVLAKLETDNLELAVLQAQTAEAQAQVAVAQAQVAAAQTEVTQTQAETALESAKLSLDKLKNIADIKDKITELEIRIRTAEQNLNDANITGNANASQNLREEIGKQLKPDLLQKQRDLAELLGKPEYAGAVNYEVLADKYGRIVVDDVRVKQLQIKAAEQSVLQSKSSVEQAKQTVEQAKRSLEQAKKSVEVAQKQLKDATVISPIDGVIATLDVKEGDIIAPPTLTTTPIIYIIEPASMELKIDVDEIDVLSIKPDQKALISLDSLPDTKLEGKVTTIALVPTVQSGIVVYEVKVAFNSMQGFDLKLGMSATVDIVVKEHKNALLVPSRAIKLDDKNKPFVEMVANQKVEQRPVVTGLSDGVQTEIISGAAEGEKVVTGKIPQKSGFFLQ